MGWPAMLGSFDDGIGQDGEVTVDWFGIPMSPLSGGYSGETFLVGEQPGAVVLRMYARNPDRAAVDASLMRLVRGIVPVPGAIDGRLPHAGSPALLVTECVEGVALDQLLRDHAAELDWTALATSLGEVLGRLSGIPFLHAGFFVDAGLAVSSTSMPTDLAEWVATHRATTRIASWAEADWQALERLADAAQQILDDAQSGAGARSVLVHSDFNAKNLLVDPQTSTVTALVDWEFAHAGSVHTDLGNLTRFERDPRLLAPLVASFARTAPGPLPDVLRCGRAADLWALVDLAGRPPGHPVAELATTLLLAQARTGDLSAWPWSAARVDPVAAHAVS